MQNVFNGRSLLPSQHPAVFGGIVDLTPGNNFAGYQLTDSEDSADIVILNTCSVRDQAERKAIGKMWIMKNLKRKKP